MTQEFKDYTDFKAGSYWVYEKFGDTAIKDSIIVSYHHQFIDSIHFLPDGPPRYEEFSDTLISSIDGKFTGDGNGLNDDYQLQYPNWPNDETTYFTPISGVQLDEWGNMTLSNPSDNLTVAGHQYQSVKAFSVNPNGGYKVVSPITNIWWARNIGVIEKTVPGTTWQLIKYHVVQ